MCRCRCKHAPDLITLEPNDFVILSIIVPQYARAIARLIRKTSQAIMHDKGLQLADRANMKHCL